MSIVAKNIKLRLDGKEEREELIVVLHCVDGNYLKRITRNGIKIIIRRYYV